MMHRRARREVMRDTASRVRKEIVRRLALPAAVGPGANKLISRAASSQAAKQNEIIEVPFGQEKSFLAPFRVGILPHADRGVVKSLHSINIHKVGDLQALSEPDLRELHLTVGTDTAVTMELVLAIDGCHLIFSRACF